MNNIHDSFFLTTLVLFNKKNIGYPKTIIDLRKEYILALNRINSSKSEKNIKNNLFVEKILHEVIRFDFKDSDVDSKFNIFIKKYNLKFLDVIKRVVPQNKWNIHIKKNENMIYELADKAIAYDEELKNHVNTPNDIINHFLMYFSTPSYNQLPEYANKKTLHKLFSEYKIMIWNQILQENYSYVRQNVLDSGLKYSLIHDNIEQLYLEHLNLCDNYVDDYDAFIVEKIITHNFPLSSFNVKILNKENFSDIQENDICYIKGDNKHVYPVTETILNIDLQEIKVDIDPILEKEKRIRKEIGLYNHNHFIKDKILTKDNIYNAILFSCGLSLTLFVLQSLNFKIDFKPTVFFSIVNHCTTLGISLYSVFKQINSYNDLEKVVPKNKLFDSLFIRSSLYLFLALDIIMLIQFGLVFEKNNVLALQAFTYAVNLIPYIVPVIFSTWTEYLKYRLPLRSYKERMDLVKDLNDMQLLNDDLHKKHFENKLGFSPKTAKDKIVNSLNNQTPEMILLFKSMHHLYTSRIEAISNKCSTQEVQINELNSKLNSI